MSEFYLLGRTETKTLVLLVVIDTVLNVLKDVSNRQSLQHVRRMHWRTEMETANVLSSDAVTFSEVAPALFLGRAQLVMLSVLLCKKFLTLLHTKLR